MELTTLTGKITAWILILQLLWVPVESGLRVLCIGADGHVALERGTGSACEDGTTAAHDDEVEVLGTVGHCGPCQDFLLGDSRLRPASREESAGHPDRVADLPMGTQSEAETSVDPRLSSGVTVERLSPVSPPLQLLC